MGKRIAAYLATAALGLGLSIAGHSGLMAMSASGETTAPVQLAGESDSDVAVESGVPVSTVDSDELKTGQVTVTEPAESSVKEDEVGAEVPEASIASQPTARETYEKSPEQAEPVDPDHVLEAESDFSRVKQAEELELGTSPAGSSVQLAAPLGTGQSGPKISQIHVSPVVKNYLVTHISSTVEGEGNLRYEYRLERSNGTFLTLSNRSSFDWKFETPDLYRLHLTVVDSLGRSAKSVETFEVEDSSPSIYGFTSNTVYDENIGSYVRPQSLFTAKADIDSITAENRVTYSLYRSNGQLVYSGVLPRFNWVFSNPGHYRLTAQVEDGYGRKSGLCETIYRVQQLGLKSYIRTEFERSIGNPEIEQIYVQIPFVVNTEGGSGSYQTQVTGYRADGSIFTRFKSNGKTPSDPLRFTWAFITPGQYRFVAETVDDSGARVQAESNYVIEKNTGLSIESYRFSRPSTRPLYAFEETRYATNVYAKRTSVPALGKAYVADDYLTYHYSLYRSNGSFVSSWEGDRFVWTFTNADDYKVVTRATDRWGASVTDTQILPIQLPALVARLVVPENVRTNQAVTFNSVVEKTTGEGLTYRFVAIRPDGSQVFLSQQSPFNWTFTTVCNFRIRLTVSDKTGRIAIDERILPVQKGDLAKQILLYLSPSNQPNNMYNGIRTSEREQMELVAELVRQELADYNVRVVLPDYVAEDRLGWRKPGPNNVEAIRWSGRPSLAAAMGADFYLAIHSNAGGGTNTGQVGPLALYHPDSQLSRQVASALVKNALQIAPLGSTVTGMQNGMAAFDGYGYSEVREPVKRGIPAVLFEVEFHDHPQTARWIVDNRSAIAHNIAKSLIETLGLQRKFDHPSVPPPAPRANLSDDMYILNRPTVTETQMRAWARSKRAADWFIAEIPTFYRLSAVTGVDPAVTYAQAALETGFGRFGGVIDVSFHNPCGLKTSIGGGDKDRSAHTRFDAWETGIQAQVDHLALYAGQVGYPKAMNKSSNYAVVKTMPGYTPDPRHFSYLYGQAKTVKALGSRWAPSSSYGDRLLGMIREIYRF